MLLLIVRPVLVIHPSPRCAKRRRISKRPHLVEPENRGLKHGTGVADIFCEMLQMGSMFSGAIRVCVPLVITGIQSDCAFFFFLLF